MSPTPINESFITKLSKALMPEIIKLLIGSFLKNVGGFKLWVLKKVLQIGGRELIEYFNEILRDHDQRVAQEAAAKILEEIRNKPDATPEEIGQAYENYYNSGRKPSSDHERAVLNKL